MFDRIVLIGAGKTSRSVVERLARIAPLTIVDTSAAALDSASTSSHEGVDGEEHPITKRVGDGTSRLVLAELRGDPRSSVALVIGPGDGQAALEACRLAAPLEYTPIVAIVNDREIAQECEKLGARALVRAEVVGQFVEQSLQQGGLGVTSALGFGRGEILEFSVLPSSPAIGVPLARLRADGWRVAAIYRGAELVLPTGRTTIAAEDRVLVVGDPKQLPHVAESLRVGIPTFPLMHGPNVIAYLPDGRDPEIEAEAEALATSTRAARLLRMYPGAVAGRQVIDTPTPDGSTARKHFGDAALEGSSLRAHIAAIAAKQPGVVVARARKRELFDVMLGQGGREAALCNEVGVPVLFARGPAYYDRVVLCVTDGEVDLGVAEIALDLARMFEVPFHILRAKLPDYLQAPESATDKLIQTILQRARLHGLSPEIRHLEGNPIAVWVNAIAPTDLAVVHRRPTNLDSFSKPDLALRVARRSTGSVLVVTAEP